MATAFRHTSIPLKYGTKYTRMVVLPPKHDDEEFYIEFYPDLISFDRPAQDAKPMVEYEALSYVWGADDVLTPLKVRMADSTFRTMDITPNLAEALPYLQLADRPRLLWVDALCIDQDNTTEKAHQVRYMGDVYQRATGVVVWLGPDLAAHARAVDLIEEIAGQVDASGASGHARMTARPGARYPQLADPMTPMDMYSQQDADALQALFRLPWFGRLWVRQEVGLARTATMQLGRRRFAVETFKTAHRCIRLRQFRGGPFDLLGDTYEMIRSYVVCVTFLTDLGRLRIMMGFLKCKDPRDLIYGSLQTIMGLSALDIEPSYTADVNDIIEDVVRKYITRWRELTFLEGCIITSDNDFWRQERLPTWVPDLQHCLDPENAINHPSLCWPGDATAGCLARTALPAPGLLRAAGVDCGAVVATFRLDGHELAAAQKCVRDAFHRLLPGRSFSDPSVVPDYSWGELFTRALLFDASSNSHSTSATWKVPFALARDAVGQLVEADEPFGTRDVDGPLGELYRAMGASEQGQDTELWPFTNNGGNVLIATSAGHVGYGPESTRPGDRLCVLLGSSVLQTLRPAPSRDGEEAYEVLGSSCVPGLNDGEALLGPLPPGWGPCLMHGASGCCIRGGFRQATTDESVPEDPRLKLLSPELRSAFVEAEGFVMTSEHPWPRYDVDPAVWPKLGVLIREFNLV